jgi:hypothetical protein
MEMNLTVTLALLAVTAAVFGYSNYRARQPAQPLKVRMINYNLVMIFSIIVSLLLLSHVVTLTTGYSIQGRVGRLLPG